MNPAPLPAGEPGQGFRVIVADDHEWIRQILVEVVRQTLPAASVVETEDGAQALQTHQNEGCDFLISNHHMPCMDGMELIREVRRQTPGLPILMVSTKPEAKADAVAAGADWFLTKDQIMEYLPPLLLKRAGDKASLAAKPTPAAWLNDTLTGERG